MRAGEWGLLKTTAVTWERGWSASAHKVPPRAFWGNTSLEIHDGDVVITKAGPRHRVGVAAYVHSTPPRLMVSGKMVLLRPHPDKVVPSVMALALATPSAQKYLDQRTTGMAESQVNFSNAVLLRCPIALPPMREQRRIAEILDTIDEAIQATEYLITKLTSARTGALASQIATSTSTPATTEVPLREMVVAPVCYGIVQPGPSITPGVPMVAIRDLNGGFENLHRVAPRLDRQHARSRIQGGDVLVSIKGTIGRTSVVPEGFTGNISRDVARLRPTSALIPGFLEAFLRSGAGQSALSKAVVGTTRAEVSIGVLAQFAIPVPTLAEQHRLVDLDEAFADRIRSEVAYARSLAQTRKGITGDLLSGRVRSVVS